MSPEVSERSFEEAIECSLLEHGPDACVGDTTTVRETLAPYGDTPPGGYRKRLPGDYDRALCLLPRDVVDFILATQTKEWQKLAQHHGGMDLTGWLEFFTEGLATQLDEVKARGEQAIRTDVLAREHGRLTIQEFQALCPGANRRTLQRDLKAMVDKGLFAERGTGPTDPTRHYRLTEALLGPGREL